MKALPLCLIAITTVGLVGFGTHRLANPDIEGAQKNLFDRFDELERMGAWVAGKDGKVLGMITKKSYDTNSLACTYGAGATYQNDGLFCTYSEYGSTYGSHSAYNPYASDFPEVLVKSNGETYRIGVLTVKKYATGKGQIINPHLLKAWLESN